MINMIAASLVCDLNFFTLANMIKFEIFQLSLNFDHYAYIKKE